MEIEHIKGKGHSSPAPHEMAANAIKEILEYRKSDGTDDYASIDNALGAFAGFGVQMSSCERAHGPQASELPDAAWIKRALRLPLAFFVSRAGASPPSGAFVQCERDFPISERRPVFHSLVAFILFCGVCISPLTAIAQDRPNASTNDSALPELLLIKTLSAPNEISTGGMFQSGNSGLTWSPDGERLAAYVHSGLGIIIWSADGSLSKEFPRYNNFGLNAYVLNFMSGHRLLVSSPSAETNSEDDRARITNAAFSILDAETGRVLRSVVGPNPDKGAPFNVALHAAVSPDEKLLAIVFRSTAKQMAAAIYSTENWQRIASANFPSDEFEFETRSLAFSPDGKLLAILNGLRGRVLLFDTTSWNLLQSFDAFPDTAPPLHVVIGGALAFSPNNKMLAVASFGGGSWWHDKNGALSTEGSGSLVPEFPAESVESL